MRDLSVIIAARNEMFLPQTVANVLKKLRADTEVIVVLDGAWPEVPLPQNDRLNIIYHSESTGQRQACNEAVRLSRAKYIMKLDAHCTVGLGFDTVLINSAQELGRETTQIPMQFNLHAFDWVCPNGHRRYQGPSGVCKECGQPTVRDILMKPRWNRMTNRWRFDKDLKFNYWQSKQKTGYIKTLSCLGACWFMERERYWDIGGMDEEHGSWGQMGTELGCKSWLSGGRMVTNMNTWFSHMFRTQGGDFSFPYEMHGRDQHKAQKHSRDIWLNNKWPKAKYSLKWLLQKFWPIPGWTDEDLNKL
jgi:glycosyltransferase involved in cell wall biosynthesis